MIRSSFMVMYLIWLYVHSMVNPTTREMPVTSSPKIVISSYRYLELLLNAAERQFVKGIGSVAVVA